MSFFSPLIQRFRHQYPGITLSVRDAGGELIEQWIADGELDVGVSIQPVQEWLTLDSVVLGRFRSAWWGRMRS
ncbi:MAG: hypothetical protein KGI91_11995 [Burkholderiales bacterium]|nr:hypothetical protein [Burkholderiales bacterium]MDE2077776.1 hypothetical protein [Burkholderiales bacterium]MDE2432274.1 hypothetical protein [Burkholderiales bacterium]